eukprot:g7422.t1
MAPTPELERPASTRAASRSSFQRQVSDALGLQRQPSGGQREELRPRSAPQLRRKGPRPKNPFIEYDAREKRLNQERKWLQEASGFLEQRRNELRQSAKMKHLDLRSDTDDRLYEHLGGGTGLWTETRKEVGFLDKEAPAGPNFLPEANARLMGCHQANPLVSRQRSERVCSLEASEIFGVKNSMKNVRTERVVSLDVETLGLGFPTLRELKVLNRGMMDPMDRSPKVNQRPVGMRLLFGAAHEAEHRQP